MTSLTFHKLAADDQADFIARLQASFTAGAVAAMEWEGAEPVISEAEIRESMDGPGADSWDIRMAGDPVAGAVVTIDENGRHGSLDLLFVDTAAQGLGLGGRIWSAIEALYPNVELWRTITPYSDKRNVHFYVNKCGFQVVEFFHPGHPDPNDPARGDGPEPSGPAEMLAFEKSRSTSSGEGESSGPRVMRLGEDVVEFRFGE